MKRSTLNIITDLLSFVSFVFLTSTGLVLEYLLPPRSGHARSVLGFVRHDWGNVHLIAAAIFFGILAVHLILHWRWVIATLKGHSPENTGWRIAIGVFGLLTLIIIAVIPFIAGVENSSNPRTLRDGFQRHHLGQTQDRE